MAMCMAKLFGHIKPLWMITFYTLNIKLCWNLDLLFNFLNKRRVAYRKHGAIKHHWRYQSGNSICFQKILVQHPLLCDPSSIYRLEGKKWRPTCCIPSALKSNHRIQWGYMLPNSKLMSSLNVSRSYQPLNTLPHSLSLTYNGVSFNQTAPH